MSDINDNIISRKWQERCSKLHADVREKLGMLENTPPSEYQLQVIKRSRAYPEIGDIFKINPTADLDLFGIVLNNHISKALQSVDFPDDLWKIDQNAFAGCTSLKSLAIPMGADVEKAAFKGSACEITYRGKKYSAGKYSGIYKK